MHGPPPCSPVGRDSTNGRDNAQGVVLNAVDVLVVGALAGAFSKTVTAPIDRVRIMYQVNDLKPFSLRNAGETVAQITRESGPQGLWRGNVAILWRVAPFSGIQFLVWDSVSDKLREYPYFEESDEVCAFIAGGCAGIAATVATYPLDLLRARQAVGFNYKNYPSAVETILRKEGPKGLFRGLAPTVIGMVPYSAISFGTYEALKNKLRYWHGVDCDSDVPVAQRLAAGGLCGTASQLVAYPLHIVRRRMQVQPYREIGAAGSLAYQNTHQALVHIGTNEGILKGLYKSVSLSWLKGPLTVGLAFVTNDALKGLLRGHYARHEGDQFAPLPGQGHHAYESDGSRAQHRQPQAIERLVCGGLAGSAAKTVIAPGDRVKIMFQTDTTKPFTWKAAWGTGRDIYMTQGLRGLWRGHSATLLRVAPYSATSFAVFDTYKAVLRENSPRIDEVYVRFFAGAGAGMTATALTYPFDLFRARMAAHRGRDSPYDGYLRASVHIVRTEGYCALFSGLRPTLLGIVPYAGITFCLFETFKAKLVSPGQDLGMMSRMGAGAFAGLLAQTATYPLDIVRRRMQVMPGLYRHEGHALASIFRTEGQAGLYKGLSMNWIKGPIAVGVSFAVNDFLRELATTT